ncbi:MAG: hypothetical protein IJ936_01860, partial [Peptococcaceae bacterium]|nr:hypothetical protein [Peptococcaceae bacterium]
MQIGCDTFLNELEAWAPLSFAETDRLREKYGYTEYAGEPLEFHKSGMVTFALLGTKAKKEDKLVFD